MGLSYCNGVEPHVLADAGTFRKENLYKSERVLSGGSAEYADYYEIEVRLEKLLQEYANFDWIKLSKKARWLLIFCWHYGASILSEMMML